MAGSEARHLRSAIGRRVKCWLDNPTRTCVGVLEELRPSGPRVRFTDGLCEGTRTVAAWRISLLPEGET